MIGRVVLRRRSYWRPCLLVVSAMTLTISAWAQNSRTSSSGGSGIEVQDMSVSLRAHTSNPITLSLVAGRFEGDPAVKGVQVFNPGAPPCR